MAEHAPIGCSGWICSSATLRDGFSHIQECSWGLHKACVYCCEEGAGSKLHFSSLAASAVV